MANTYSDFEYFEGYLELHGNWIPGESPDDAASTLLGVAGYYGNLEVPLLEAQRIAEADTAERFDSETDPDDFPWEELSDEYWHNKVELDGFPDEILTREALLRDVAPTGWHIVGPDLVYDPSVLPKTESGFSYGAAMQSGTRGKGAFSRAEKAGRIGAGFSRPPKLGGVPPRPFIGLSEEAIVKIAGGFETWAETIPIEQLGRGRGIGSNVLGEFPAVGGFFRPGGYQPIIKLPSGGVRFGKMIR